MPSSRQLYQLQEVDWEIDSRRVRLAVIEEQLGDERVLQELRARLAEIGGALEQNRAAQRDREAEGEEHQQKATKVEAQLYGGSVVSPRELSDLQAELSQIRGQQKPVEDAALELMEQVENLERQTEELQSQLSEETQRWKVEQANLGVEQARLREEIASLDQRRQGITPGLGSATLGVYEQLRRSRRGHAVAKVERGMCLGCRIRLPTHELQRAQADREMVQCTSCSRILYVS